MKTLKILLIVVVVVFSSLSGYYLYATYLNGGGEEQTRVAQLYGIAYLREAGGKEWVPLQEGAVLKEKDTVRTAANGEVDLTLSNGAIVRLKGGSSLEVDREILGKEVVLSLHEGKVLSKVSKLRKDSWFEVATPTAVAGVRGTAFLVEYFPGEKKGRVAVLQGIVAVYNQSAPGQVVILEAKMSTTVVGAQRPEVPRPVTADELKELLELDQLKVFAGKKESQDFAKRVEEEAGVGAMKAKISMGYIQKSLQVYNVKYGRYPGSLDDVVREGLLQAEETRDPWGESYDYEPMNGGKVFKIASAGPDHRRGSADDVTMDSEVNVLEKFIRANEKSGGKK